MPGQTDLRRPDRVQRYVPPKQPETSSADHINAIGMVCSLVGLLIKVIFNFRQTLIWVFIVIRSDEVGCVDWSLLFTDLHGQQQSSWWQETNAQFAHVSINILNSAAGVQTPVLCYQKLFFIIRLATSSLVMVYMQNPAPMTLPFT